MKCFIKNIGIFLLLIIIFNILFKYFYEKPDRQAILNKTHWKYVQWNAMHNQSNRYDVIFLGSSRGYCAYNPLVFDSILNTNSYNMCTGSQNTIESYYILKEILRFQKPKVIVYEMFLPCFGENIDYYNVLSNGSFMTPKGEMDMVINGFGLEGIANYLIPSLKHQLYVGNYINSLFSLKKNREINNEEKYIMIKGYISDSTIVDSSAIKEFSPIYSLENTPINEKKLYYFDKLLELCRIYKIRLVCVRTNYPPSRLEISGIDTENMYFTEICKNYKIPFYDFNYLTKTENKDSDFTDNHHMNYLGANKVSKQLAELLFEYLQ